MQSSNRLQSLPDWFALLCLTGYLQLAKQKDQWIQLLWPSGRCSKSRSFQERLTVLRMLKSCNRLPNNFWWPGSSSRPRQLGFSVSNRAFEFIDWLHRTIWEINTSHSPWCGWRSRSEWLIQNVHFFRLFKLKPLVRFRYDVVESIWWAQQLSPMSWACPGPHLLSFKHV